MIYCDRMGHLISDTTLDELHNFAQSIGLKRSWFQDKPGYEHYDLTTARARKRAIWAGAILIDMRKLIKMQPGYKKLATSRETGGN